MTRSIWKAPFIDNYVLKLVENTLASNKKNKIIKIRSRRSTILPNFIGLSFAVYNGKSYVPVTVVESMIGRKFGEFSPTRTYYGHGADKKTKKK